MRTTEEMVLAVHERMNVLQRRQENRRISLAGGGCAVLGAAVAALIARFGGTRHTVLPGEYAGASLLAAFMAGAAVTVFIRARKKRQNSRNTEE